MTIRKNKTFTITVAPIDNTNRPSRLSGISFTGGDVKISKNAGAFANTTNLPAEIATASARYSLVLTDDEMNGDNIHIFIQKASIDPIDYVLQTSGEASGTVVTDGSNTATTFKTDRTEAVNDYWRDALILFTSGALVGQVKKIAGYTGSTKFVIASSAFTGTPVNGDRFVIVNL